MFRRLILSTAFLGLSAALGYAAEPAPEKTSENNSAPSGNPVLKVIPDNALAVVLVNNLTEVDAMLVRVGRQAGLPSVSPLAMAKAMLEVSEGLDEKGTMALAVMPGSEDGPPAAPLVFVPVTDYAKFIAPLSPEKTDGSPTQIVFLKEAALVAKKGNYAVFTATQFDDTLQAAIAAKGNLSAQLAPLDGWIAEHHLSAIATNAGIKLVIGKARESLQQVKNNFPPNIPNAQQTLAMFDIYDKMFQAADEQLNVAAVSLRADKDANVHLTSSWRLKRDAPFSKSLAAVAALPGKPLADLPAGPYMLAGGGALPEDLFAGLWTSEFMKMSFQSVGLDGEQIDKLAKLSKESMRGVRGASIQMGIPADDEAVLQGLVGTMGVDNAAQYMEMAYKQLDERQEIIKAANSSVFNGYELKKLEIDGAKAIEIVMDLSASVPPQARKTVVPIYEKMFGPDGKMTMTYLPADDKTIFFTYCDSEATKKLAAFKARRAGLAGDPQVAKAMALLPKDAQWFGVWDIAGTMEFIKRAANAFASGGPPPALPDVPAAPPIGFAAHVSAEGLNTDLVIPAETFKVVGQLVPRLLPGGGGFGAPHDGPTF